MLTASETGLKIKAVQIWLSLQIEGIPPELFEFRLNCMVCFFPNFWGFNIKENIWI